MVQEKYREEMLVTETSISYNNNNNNNNDEDGDDNNTSQQVSSNSNASDVYSIIASPQSWPVYRLSSVMFLVVLLILFRQMYG